jgi:hypothetical protein
MGNFKITTAQLNALQKAIKTKTTENLSNQNYTLDYVRFMVHPTMNDYVILKSRRHGISGGLPFDEIDYIFLDSNGKVVDVRKQFFAINGWYEFVSEMKEVKIVNGNVEFI